MECAQGEGGHLKPTQAPSPQTSIGSIQQEKTLDIVFKSLQLRKGSFSKVKQEYKLGNLNEY